MNIFVGNLSFEAKEIDVQRVFAGFGVVTGVVIVMEKKGKKSRGFGFVEMPDEQEALAAIAVLNGKEILGRPINVMTALPKEEKTKHHAPKDRDDSYNKDEPKENKFFKREDKYKRGRRSLSYMKKFGAAPTDSRSKFKANPLRWRKRTTWSKPVETSKPWDKAGEQPKPWVKREDGAKPWVKREGSAKPWQKKEGVVKPWQKREGGAKPWVKREDSVKPWARSEGSAKPSRFKRTISIVRNKR